MSAVPNLANGDSTIFWNGAREGRLLFQKCKGCGAVQFPPRYQCAACWEAELEWIESSGAGTIESFTIVRRAPAAALRDRTPYVVASVIVEEGPRMITNLTGAGAMDVQMGDEVHVVFADDGAGNVLPQFELGKRK